MNYRTRALVALAPYLSSELQAQVIEVVRNWPVFSWSYRSKVLAALVPYLSEALLPEALAAAREIIQQVYDPINGQMPLAYHYPADQVPGALVTIAPILPRDLLPEALAAVSDIQVGDARGHALAQLAPYLPDDLLPYAVELARKIESPFAGYRAVALAALSQHGLPVLLDEAIRAAQQIQEGDESVTALPALLVAGATITPTEQRSTFLNEALTTIQEIQDTRHRADALIGLAALLAPEERREILDKALAEARGIHDARERSLALCRLIPYLPSTLRSITVDEALENAQTIDSGPDTGDKITAQVVLLPHLAPFLSPHQLKRTLKVARSVHSAALRGSSLAALAPHLPPAERSKVVEEALEAAREMKGKEDRGERIKVLALIVPHLPDEQRTEALDEILDAVEEVDMMFRLELGLVLAELVPHLTSRFYPRALAIARQIWSPHALLALLPLAPLEERLGIVDEAFIAARGIGSAAERTHMLALLVPHFPPERQVGILRIALETTQQMDMQGETAQWLRAFSSLASAWAQLPRPQAYTLWPSTLRNCAARRRAHCLVLLAGLMPAIKALGGMDSVTEVMYAVLEVCRQWSWMYSSSGQ